MMRRIHIILSILVLSGFFVAGARADDTSLSVQSAAPDDLEQQIKEKQDTIKRLESQINNYQKSIAEKQKESTSLKNQLGLLDAQISKAELDLQLVTAQIAQLELEIKVLSGEISSKNDRISRQQDLLAGLVRALHQEDKIDYLYILLSEPSFSQFFNQVFYLGELNNQLDQSVRSIEKARDDVQEQHDITARKQELLKNLEVSLEQKRATLDDQKKAREVLLRDTKSSEAKFRTLLAQLRGEFARTDQEILDLNRKLRERLLSHGDVNEQGVLVLSWPIPAIKGISAYFHDSSYPFRYLFEHPGIDLPTKVGTPVAAAAPGVVAWVRTTRFYGNNIMIAHRVNVNTIYAHLSNFNVKEGDYVKRGDIIGYSGGASGMQGAGLSTGAHLHFEVRENGLPVDPMRFLTK
ncbi:MAG: Peptidase M23 [Candidatus Magasanikbacteria bacterium GW2011_GWA2_45_39]|uniref:Peptidase M23 n=1 Tax=Candidatus Magasanikbacteria bacterium GW2011_GWA2_45_39 TaxID=1619041 RepID=A0A0G1MG97_9BACT|nr:MAG: Peptidase M23 [Candidatus Magasanikbacteria bacterium GW2011_GWA2_45_39]